MSVVMDSWPAAMGRAGRNDRSLLRRGLVQPLAHFLAGLEERHGFLIDRNMRAGARIAPGTRRAMFHRERAEAAQLHAVAARERGRDLTEHGIHDVLDVALIEMRILSGDALNKLGFD